MSLALLNRQPVTWDSEAASYLTAVESADTQSLELPVARAINQFVIDCKVRGIWGAIKSSCLLCGARTLNGALVPLKGAAPTSFNFTDGDYNRETGLKGNGSNKYLDTNRLGSADDTNNKHISVYVSTATTMVSTYPVYIGQNTVSGNDTVIFRQTNDLHSRFNSPSGDIAVGKGTSTGFIGSSRSNSSSYILRVAGSNILFSRISGTPAGGNMFVFTNVPLNSSVPSNGRLSFYSIGESLDLRLLEQCVEKYINMINILI